MDKDTAVEQFKAGLKGVINVNTDIVQPTYTLDSQTELTSDQEEQLRKAIGGR